MKEMKVAATYIREKSSLLIENWEAKARAQILSAKSTTKPILQNHLEDLLQDLADALDEMNSPDEAREIATSTFTKRLSILHANTRMEAGNYKVQDVLEEYILLRHVVTDELAKDRAITTGIIEIVNRLFELSSLEAVNSFQKQVDENREKLILSLAHDLRSPLAVAKMGLGEISQQDLSPSEYKQFLDMAVESVDRALVMSTQMLDAYTVESGGSLYLSFEELDLDTLLEEITSQSQMRYGSNITYVSDSKSDFNGVFAKNLLARVIENLISNSVKYGDPKKDISVELKKEGSFVVLSVHNFGKAISSESQKTIFNLFFSEGSAAGASDSASWGVGLTHLHLAARAHFGHVDLVSSEDSGTTFRIFLNPNENVPGGKRVKFDAISSVN